MHPRVDDGLAGESLALRYLAFVMREDVVNAAGVNVERFAKILDGHGGTFYVPAREAFAPRAIPLDHAPGFGGFPQREVARIAFERVRLGSHRFQKFSLVNVAG